MISESEAIRLLEELGITKLPIIPQDICATLNILYLEEEFKCIDGVLIISPSGKTLIGVNSAIREPGRKNFTYAHEIGHLCMHSQDQSEFYCSRDLIGSFKSKIHPSELEANRFAAELLMPRFIYEQLVRVREPGWDTIKELASLSQTTLTATAKRFMDLTDHACALIISEKRIISSFHPSKEFRAYIDPGIVSTETIAYSAFRGSQPPDNFEGVKADNWLSGRGVRPHTEILEWTLPINSYGQVLTLLFDEEGIQGWEEDGYLDDEDDVQWEPPTFHKSKRKK
ncbi:MAG: ImmA/IrrE family metallo-endopeptidase [Candidatus Hodarchaeota archaeon]